MAVSTIRKMAEIRTDHKTGTANSGGNFYVGADDGWKIVSAIETGSANRIYIPFRTGDSLYLKVLDWTTTGYVPVANGSVNVDITYIR